MRIVARTGRKWLHKIGTAKRIPTIREPEKASDSCEDNANTKSGEAPDLPTTTEVLPYKEHSDLCEII